MSRQASHVLFGTLLMADAMERGDSVQEAMDGEYATRQETRRVISQQHAASFLFFSFEQCSWQQREDA